MIGMILIDLEKPLTQLPTTLLQKLYAISSLRHAVNFFKSDLSNRSILINFGNSFLSICF